jgi:hypothetical protein
MSWAMKNNLKERRARHQIGWCMQNAGNIQQYAHGGLNKLFTMPDPANYEAVLAATEFNPHDNDACDQLRQHYREYFLFGLQQLSSARRLLKAHHEADGEYLATTGTRTTIRTEGASRVVVMTTADGHSKSRQVSGDDVRFIERDAEGNLLLALDKKGASVTVGDLEYTLGDDGCPRMMHRVEQMVRHARPDGSMLIEYLLSGEREEMPPRATARRAPSTNPFSITRARR